MIDRNLPIRFVGDHKRPCHNVGFIEMPGQPLCIFVTSIYGNGDPWEQPMTFNLDGTPHNPQSGGQALRIENVPLRTSGFYPMQTNGATTGGRGLISLSMAKDEYSSFKFFLEVVCVDGVPTEAFIHAR